MNELNAPLKQTTETIPLKTVSVGTRFSHCVIDSVCINLIYCICSIVSILADATFDTIRLQTIFITHFAPTYLLFIIFYYVVCEHLFGKTIGKHYTNSLVVTESGEKPSLRDIISRSVVRLIPFEPLSVVSASTRMWHDTWTKTIVIKADTIQHNSFSD